MEEKQENDDVEELLAGFGLARASLNRALRSFSVQTLHGAGGKIFRKMSCVTIAIINAKSTKTSMVHKKLHQPAIGVFLFFSFFFLVTL